MFGLGIWEVVLILIVALLVLGPDKLPTVARQLGRSLRELRKAAGEFQATLASEVRDLDEVRQAGKAMEKELRAVPGALTRAATAEPESGTPGTPGATAALPSDALPPGPAPASPTSGTSPGPAAAAEPPAFSDAAPPPEGPPQKGPDHG